MSKSIGMLADDVEYYEALIDYLYDVVPCIDAVIAEFDVAWENNADES